MNTAVSEETCLFCKIVRKEIPSRMIYEDADTYAFLDIQPVNPGHTLVIPKKHARDVFEIEESEWIAVMRTARIVAHALESALGIHGVNVDTNNREAAGQLVFHSHVHVIPRYEGDGFEQWPSTAYKEGEADAIAAKITAAIVE